MTFFQIISSTLPENILIMGLLLILLFEMILPQNKLFPLLLTAIILGGTFLSLFYPPLENAFETFYLGNNQTSLLKMALLLIALPIVIGFRSSFYSYKAQALFISAILGAFYMISSLNFLTLFLGLELLAFPTYVLVFLGTKRSFSAEASLKYLVLGSTASAIFLLSGVFLYAATGTFSLMNFENIITLNTFHTQLFFLFFVLAFFFKTALVPFHQWAPDVYDGADLGITSFMAVFIKAAYFLTLGRLFGQLEITPLTLILFGIVPLASILWGNLAAIKQTNFSRLMAYSSIAHAAYIYYAFIGTEAERLPSLTFYILSYGLVVAASFITLNYLSDELHDLKNFKGLFKRHPWPAGILSFCFLSLAGLPPLPGFFAKFYIFKNVLAEGHTTYALAAFLASYIGIYFYLKLIVLMYMTEEETELKAHRKYGSVGFALGSLFLLVPAIWLTTFFLK